MANDGFNGTTATFGGTTLGKGITGCGKSGQAAAVDVTVSTDTTKQYVRGIKDKEFTIDFVGNTTVSEGDVGALVFTWNDGTTDSLGTVMCSSCNTKGQIDGAIAGSATFKPTTEAAGSGS